jgi:hypothetical protein
MGKLKIGDKVVLNPRYARWHLDHPEVYFFERPTRSQLNLFNIEVQMHLMASMGVPVTGTVTEQGSDEDTFGVEFRVAGLKTFYYVDRFDVSHG